MMASPPRQPPPTSDPSSLQTPAIELPELSPDHHHGRGRTLSSASSAISETPGSPLSRQHPPSLSSGNRPSSATNSESDASLTPPNSTSRTSTPATSLRPSFSSNERPSSENSDSRIDGDDGLSPRDAEVLRHPHHLEGRVETSPEIVMESISEETRFPSVDEDTGGGGGGEEARGEGAAPTNSPPTRTQTSQSILRKMAPKTIIQNVIGVTALIITFIATVYYGHRADRMDKMMSIAAFRQDCWSQIQNNFTLSERCKVELNRGSPLPPYEKLKRSMEWAVAYIQNSTGLTRARMAASTPTAAPRVESPSKFSYELSRSSINSMHLAILLLQMFVILGCIYFYRWQRQIRMTRRVLGSGPDLVRNVPPFMIIRELRTGHHIGLRHRQPSSSSSNASDDLEIESPRRRYLSIPVIPDEPRRRSLQDHFDDLRKRSLQDHFEDLHSEPDWKSDLEFIISEDDNFSSEVLYRQRIPPSKKTPNMYEDDSDSEEPDNCYTTFKRFIHNRIHHVPYLESQLTPLGAMDTVTLEHSFNHHAHDKPGHGDGHVGRGKSHTRRRSGLRIRRGLTSMGVLAIGTSLGASVGGKVGHEMLVKGVDREEVSEMMDRARKEKTRGDSNVSRKQKDVTNGPN